MLSLWLSMCKDFSSTHIVSYNFNPDLTHTAIRRNFARDVVGAAVHRYETRN